MEGVVEQLLISYGPCLTTALARLLSDQHGLSPAAARQRISRRSPDVRVLDDLPFPKNARFVYHKSDYGSPRFWKALQAALSESSPAYSSALRAIAERDGLVPQRHFHIVSGAPLHQQHQVSSETLLKRLLATKLFDIVEVPGVGECVAYAKGDSFIDRPVAAMKARLLTEDIVLNAVRDWARNLALGSYGSFKLRSDDDTLPQIGSFAWDLSAPSYVSALTNGFAGNGSPKPGFIACDILLGRIVSESGLQPFVRKCKTLRTLRKVGRCLQIFIADDYAPDAFRLARGAGIVPATPRTLFGEDVAAALLQLLRILRDAASASVRPQEFDLLFRQLGKIEGAANSLRGALFEFVVAEVVRKLWIAHITMNRIFREGGRDAAEVDVLAVIPNQRVLFIECKGHAPNGVVAHDEVVRWLTKRVPFLRTKALSHPDWAHLPLHFELWTSGMLSPETADLVAQAAQSTHKYTLAVRTAKEIASLAEQTGDSALMKVLNQHFLEHPLADSLGKAIEDATSDRKLAFEVLARTVDTPVATASKLPRVGYSAPVENQSGTTKVGDSGSE